MSARTFKFELKFYILIFFSANGVLTRAFMCLLYKEGNVLTLPEAKSSLGIGFMDLD